MATNLPITDPNLKKTTDWTALYWNDMMNKDTNPNPTISNAWIVDKSFQYKVPTNSSVAPNSQTWLVPNPVKVNEALNKGTLKFNTWTNQYEKTTPPVIIPTPTPITTAWQNTGTWWVTTPSLNQNIPWWAKVVNPTPTTPASTTGAETISIPSYNDEINNYITAFKNTWYNLSPDEEAHIRAWLTDYLKSWQTAQGQVWLQNEEQQYKQAFENFKTNLDTYRQTKSFQSSMDRLNVENQRKITDMTQQYDTAIKNQQQNIETIANNNNMVEWTSGRLRSSNMTNSLNQELNNSKDLYSQLVSNKSRDLQRLAEDLKYAQDNASDEFNKAVSQEQQTMLKNLETIKGTWIAKTLDWLQQAKSIIEKSIENNMYTMWNYYQKLNYINTTLKQAREERFAENKVDDTVTKQMNDWYLYNANWIRVMSEEWQPIKVNNVNGTFLKVDSKPDGTQFALYQMPDWKIEVRDIEWTAPTKVNTQMLKNLVAQAQKGTLDLKTLQTMWLPEDQYRLVAWSMKPTKTVDKSIDLWNTIRLWYNDWTSEDIKKTQNKEVQHTIDLWDKVKVVYSDWTSEDLAKWQEQMTPYQSANLAWEKQKYWQDLWWEKEKYNRENAIWSTTWVWQALDEDIKRIWWDTNLTWWLIESVANEYWVNPAFLGAVLRNDSSYWKHLYSKNNYWNVWNTDTLVANGKKWVEFATPEEWVGATAENLAKRIKAYKDKFWSDKTPSVQEILSWKNNKWEKFFWVYMTDKSAYDRVANITKDLMWKVDKTWWWQPGTSWLSKQAQDIFMWKASFPTWKEWNKIKEELSNAWVYDLWEWNEKFITAKPTEKQDITALIRAREAVDKIRSLYDWMKDTSTLWNPVWPLDSWLQATKNLWWFTTKEYNDLKNLTTKELNTYINQITWAAVWVSEAPRLKSVIPTIDSSEWVFESNLDQFTNQAQAMLENALWTYWFKDLETAKQKLWIKTTVWQSTQTQTTTNKAWWQTIWNKKDLFNQFY